jgi:hypothetical protein
MTITSEKAAICRKVRHLFEAAHHLQYAGHDQEPVALNLERHAHSLWVSLGEKDMNTFMLWNHVTDVVLSLESGSITVTN